MTFADILRRRMLDAVDSGLRIGADRREYELVRRHFYSPLPDVDGLPESLWSNPADLVGLDLRVDQAVAWMEAELRPYLAEFRPPATRPPEGGFFLSNRFYESVDAETLYAIVRVAKPRTLVELGSGASSHVIDRARRRHAAEGHEVRHVIYDPYPFAAGSMGSVPGAVVHRQRVEDLDLRELADTLHARDVLFVDTTHTVKTGGDVTRIYLELFPRLRAGVLVHVHDIFLPFEYPRAWVVEERRAWAEQYLLQAFLAFNADFEVVFPAHAVSRLAPAALRAAIPSFREDASPAAFWMRRVR